MRYPNAFELIAIVVDVGVSFILAWLGRQRKIGFYPALLISLIFSPLVGFFFVSLSKRNDNTDNSNKKPSSEFDIDQFRKG